MYVIRLVGREGVYSERCYTLLSAAKRLELMRRHYAEVDLAWLFGADASWMVVVQEGEDRARLYEQGGIGFDHRIKGGCGWVVDDEPSLMIRVLAVAAREKVFPELPVMQLGQLSGEAVPVSGWDRM